MVGFYAVLATDEPETTVQFDESGKGGKPLALQFQIFAFAEGEIVAVSNVCALVVAA